LPAHVLIGFDQETVSIRALRRLGLKLRRDDFAFRTDSHIAQLAAIRAGFGIGIAQTAIARRIPILSEYCLTTLHLLWKFGSPCMKTSARPIPCEPFSTTWP